MHIAALRTGRVLPHTRPVELRSPAGAVVGTMEVASAAAIGPTLEATRVSAAAWRRRPAAERIALVEGAGAALAEAPLVIGGATYTFDDIVGCTSRLLGIPERDVRAGYRALAHDLAHAGTVLRAASATGDLTYYENVGSGNADGHVQWTPVGDALAIVAPGNVIPVHAMWAVLVAAGFPVVVKPSGGDPLTPARVVAALIEAGVPPELLSLLPLDGADVPLLTQLAPGAVAFGDDVTLARLPNLRRGYGPGRSLAIVTDAALQNPAVRADVFRGMTADAGRGCINTSVVAVVGAGDAGLELLARDLASLRAHALHEETAVLGALSDEVASAWAARLDGAVAEGGTDYCASHRCGGRLERTADGTFLLPALIEVARDAPARQWEVPAPVAWVVRWPETVLRDGVAVLEGPPLQALVASQFVDSDPLFASLCVQPGIGKVYQGLPTTCTDLCLPHAGFITDGLFIAKAVRRA